MQITEDKIRQITQEAIHILGPHVNPSLLKMVVKEVVNRLITEPGSENSSQSKLEERNKAY